MKRKILGAAIAGAFCLCGAVAANAQDYRYQGSESYRLARAPDWNPNAEFGNCHLRISVDDRATVRLHGDQIIVHTQSGRRAFDQGSVCTQPLPAAPVSDFRVTANQARGRVIDVRDPTPQNDFTGVIAINDPQPGSSTYDLVVSWRNFGRAPVAINEPPVYAPPPVAANEPYPFMTEAQACQEQVRGEFLSRNGSDAYLDFRGMAERSDAGYNRERISGRAMAHNRDESRFVTYECVLNERTNRVLTATYDVRGPARYSSLQ